MAHSICNSRFNVPKEIPVVFHNGLNYNYYFVIKELEKEFEGQFGNEDIITTTYKIKFINSIRFLVSSLWNLVDNLEEGTHTIKCKDCNCFLEYKSVNGNLTNHKCLSY